MKTIEDYIEEVRSLEITEEQIEFLKNGEYSDSFRKKLITYMEKHFVSKGYSFSRYEIDFKFKDILNHSIFIGSNNSFPDIHFDFKVGISRKNFFGVEIIEKRTVFDGDNSHEFYPAFFLDYFIDDRKEKEKENNKFLKTLKEGKFHLSYNEINRLVGLLKLIINEIDNQLSEFYKSKESNSKEVEKLKKSLLVRGKVNVINSDSFNVFLKNHQKEVIQVDKRHIRNFVKISNYLKLKQENLDSLFQYISKIPPSENVRDYLGVLQNHIHSYNIILHLSFMMIISLLEGDIVTYYELYETFDEQDIFNANWEYQVSVSLSNASINDIIYKVHKSEYNLISKLSDMNNILKSGSRELDSNITKELKNINPSINLNNLLQVIQNYQVYKNNKKYKII